MSKFLTAVLLLSLSSVACADLPDEVNPVPLKERVKHQLWSQGVPEFKRPMNAQKPLPEEISRILLKYNL